MTDRRELHDTRLSTTDENGRRVYVHPEDVKGKWRNRRTIFYYILGFVFIIMPWITFKGKQLILFNIPSREFTLFGEIFYGHDGVYFFFFLGGWLFLFALISSVAGRTWCGWACPQTVFIDLFYLPIERFFEGNSRQRKKLEESKFSLRKLLKKVAKWICFIIVSLIISHSFLAYFVGQEVLIDIVRHSPKENWTVFISMIITTIIILLDFGWFREQFCLIACPYGRFQSVMMDDNSLVVAYDFNRGEPRGVSRNSDTPKGDCINCFQCVAVCPTGIDIRRGTQLECIACTSCIDACDKIMAKLKREPGLIRYTSENKLNKLSKSTFSYRNIFYAFALVLFVGVGSFLVSHSGDLKMIVMRGSTVPYRISTNTNGEEIITNHFRAELRYKRNEELNLSFTTNQLPGLELITPQKNVKLKSVRNKMINLFIKFPRKGILVNGARKIKIKVLNSNKVMIEKEVSLVGPYN